MAINPTLTLLGKMLDLGAARQRTIAGNVANVNTPNYRRQVYSFKDALEQAMAGGDINEVKGTVERPRTTLVRNNGNNVDVEQEMNDLNENSVLYGIYSQLYAMKSQGIKNAIKG